MNLDEITGLLLNRDPLPPLSPQQLWRKDLSSWIKKLDTSELVKASLHLWNDNIDACHRIVQDMDTAEAEYWHAILHRREGDFSNSKYWYRRVGEHSVFIQLRKDHSDWNPFDFIDQCEAGADEKSLQLIQADEMKHLFQFVLSHT